MLISNLQMVYTLHHTIFFTIVLDSCQMTRKYCLQNFMKINWELTEYSVKVSFWTYPLASYELYKIHLDYNLDQ